MPAARDASAGWNLALVASLRFYARLNHFLAPEQRQQTIPYPLNDRTSVKHAVEATGVPHTEVELLLVDNRPVTFDYILRPGNRVAVYPAFHTLIAPGPPLRPPLPDPVRFVLDVHLGQLATYLRLLGFDTLYRNDYDDPELAETAAREGRVLITRDRRLLMRNIVVYGFCLNTREPQTQLLAVLRRYRLFDAIAESRCLRCNGLLAPIAKAAILHRLEPKTRRYYDDFYHCLDCDQIYWQGSHYERLQAFISAVRRQGEKENSFSSPAG